MSTSKITKIQAREILDSRGNPTVETTVWAGSVSSKAAVPSGASTGTHEALELRDGDKNRYLGKGVLKACKNVNLAIFKALKGRPVTNQQEIDSLMLALDGTANKSKLGANAILSVSLAAARVGAKLKSLELYEYLAKIYGYKIKNLPTPLFNVINGGAHADSGLDVQEFFIIPQTGRFSEKLRKGVEVFYTLKNILAKKHLSTSVGDEGGFAPRVGSSEAALNVLSQAVKTAGYKVKIDFKFGMDVAATEFYDSKKQIYASNTGKTATAEQMIKNYLSLVKKYPISVMEDGLAEDDFSGWKFLTEKLGKQMSLVGDDLFVTNVNRINIGIAEKMANAVLIKVNQIGSLTETMDAIKLSQKNKYKVIISHRSGETSDDFISDLAVAVNAEYIKTGAPSRGERVAKYNRLLEIETNIK